MTGSTSDSRTGSTSDSTSGASANPITVRWQIVASAAIALWLACWLYATRYAMLDDALIHLRYAANLHSLHIFSYDGLRPNFGASSLAYVGLLSLLRGLTTSPLLAKATSVIAYLVLIITVAAYSLRMRASLATRALAYGMLLCLLSPMGIRWLTDGMESGLVILAVLLLAWLTDREAHSNALSPLPAAVLLLAGFLFVMLRIESLTLIAVVSLIIFLTRNFAAPQATSHLRSAALSALPLPAGALLAAYCVRLYFGTLLPDTAIAKTGAANLNIATAGFQVIGSSLLLGLGTLLLWLISAYCLVRACSRADSESTPAQLWVTLLANAYFPLVLALAAIRGQRIEGVRHVLWTIEFSLAWNILQLARRDHAASALPAIYPKLVRGAVYAVAIFFALLLPIDWTLAQRVMHQRALTFLKFRNSDFHFLQGKVIVAGDIGFIGYFTNAQVCDLNGLVNGRAAAASSPAQRYQSCADSHPAALFLSSGQRQRLSQYLDMQAWTPCATFDFVNVRTLDRHSLMLPIAPGAVGCESTGAAVPGHSGWDHAYNQEAEPPRTSAYP